MEEKISKQENYKNLANTIIKNLEKRQMKGYYCPDRKSALQKALELIPKNATIAWGGSVTLNEIGLMDAVKNGNYTIIDREKTTTLEEQKKVYSQICASDFFLMSTNAITLNGELINIDGRGNRVSFLCYGPENVLIIVGMNKVVSSIEAGFERASNIAAPPNAIRLNRKTPCAITGKCEDCYSPDCMCSQFIVTRRSSIPNRIKVILIGEDLGY